MPAEISGGIKEYFRGAKKFSFPDAKIFLFPKNFMVIPPLKFFFEDNYFRESLWLSIFFRGFFGIRNFCVRIFYSGYFFYETFLHFLSKGFFVEIFHFRKFFRPKDYGLGNLWNFPQIFLGFPG